MSLFEETVTSVRSPWGPLVDPTKQGVQQLQDAFNAGTYGGPYTPAINPNQTAGINAGATAAGGAPGVAGTYADFGNALAPGLTAAQGYYTGALGPDSQNPWVTNPQQYLQIAGQFAANPFLDASIDAALRDPFRQLTEQQLPGIARGYMAAGQRGAPGMATRGGVASDVATRGFLDRASDIGAQMRSAAYSQGLGVADAAAQNDFRSRENAAGALSGLGSQGLGFLGQGLQVGQLGAENLFNWGGAQYGLDKDQIAGAKEQFYEPWKLVDAYGNYLTPLTTGLSQGSETRDAGTLGPLLGILGNVLSAGVRQGGIKGVIDDIKGVVGDIRDIF
jgi:hypothetical protein